MNKTLLAIVISLVILVIVVLIYYFLVYLPSKSSVTSQAFTVASVPSNTLSATVLPSTSPSTSPVQAMYGIPFYVHSGSALAQYVGMPLTVVQGPIFVGDSAWLILSTPTGNYIAEVMDVVAAEQIGVGSVIVSGSTIIPMIL